MTSSAGVVLRGAQRPRVELLPTAVDTSDADDAVFLAAGYGLVPDEWQRRVLAGWLGRRSDGKWAATRCGLAVPRQNGKNALLEMRELYGTVVLGEKFLHTAHLVNTARKAFKRLMFFFGNRPGLGAGECAFPELNELVAEVRHTNGQEAVFLRNGGSVEIVARSKGSARGFTVDVLVFDEAQEYGEEAQAALSPTISAAPSGNRQSIYTGTPPWGRMDGTVFTGIRDLGLEGADGRLSWHDWGCDKPADLSGEGFAEWVAERANWATANPALGYGRLGAVDWEAVEDEHADMSAEVFSIERLGVWPPPLKGGGLFDPRRWAELADGMSEPRLPFNYGIDVSADRVWSTLGIAGYRQDGRVHVAVQHPARGTDWVVDECARLAGAYPGSQFVVDPSGPVASLIPALRAAGVALLELKAPDVRKACGLLIDAVKQGTVRHRAQQVLSRTMEGVVARPLGDGGIAFGRKASTTVDISPLNAVCWAHYATVLAGPGDVSLEFA